MQRIVGKLIAVEGCDGSGKTTLVANLKKWLDSAGVPVIAVALPDRGSRTGVLLDGYLRKKMAVEFPCVLHMLFAANRVECILNIASDRRNVCVIADRFTLSGQVYATAAVGSEFAAGLRACEVLAGVPEPDLTIVLDGPCADETKKHDELYETDSFQRRVAELYREESQTSTRTLKVTGMTEAQVLEAAIGIITETLG